MKLIFATGNAGKLREAREIRIPIQIPKPFGAERPDDPVPVLPGDDRSAVPFLQDAQKRIAGGLRIQQRFREPHVDRRVPRPGRRIILPGGETRPRFGQQAGL